MPQKWEYKEMIVDEHRADIRHQVLKAAGEEGWELVAITGWHMYFKRPLPDYASTED